MLSVTVFLVLSVVGQTNGDTRRLTCTDARRQCEGEVICRYLLFDYVSMCATVMHSANTCSQVCKDSYIKLISNSVGSLLHECNCGTGVLGDICTSFENSVMTKCFGNVRPTSPASGFNHTGQFTCFDFMRWCWITSTCASRYLDYLDVCSFTLTHFTCTQQCNESFYSLLRHPIGNKFSSCDCGNNTLCQFTLDHTIRICYGGNSPVPPPVVDVPTVKPVGSCERAFYNCFVDKIGSCGTDVILTQSYCSKYFPDSLSLRCPASCADTMKTVISTIPYASELTTCNCLNSTSTECFAIMGTRRLISLCGSTASAAAKIYRSALHNLVLTLMLSAIGCVLLML